MIAIIIAVFLILIVLIYTFLLLKTTTEFIANRLIDINTNLKSIINALEKPTKSK